MTPLLTPFKDLLSPSLEASIDLHDPRFDEPVALAGEFLNRKGKQHYFDAANTALVQEKTGMKYTIANALSEVPSSQTEFFIMPAPYGNDVWPHIIARAEVLSYFAAQAGLTDVQGQPLSVLVTASPSINSRYGLTPREVIDMNKGDSSSIALRHIRLAERMGFAIVRGFYAASHSSIFAADFVDIGSQIFDIDGNLVINEPANATDSSEANLIIRSLLENKSFKDTVEDEGIAIFKQIFRTENFRKGLLMSKEESWAILQCYIKGKLSRSLEKAGRAGVRSVVIHGSKSKIAKRKDVIKSCQVANSALVHNMADTHRKSPLAARIEVAGGNHFLPDRLGRGSILATLGLIAS